MAGTHGVFLVVDDDRAFEKRPGRPMLMMATTAIRMKTLERRICRVYDLILLDVMMEPVMVLSCVPHSSHLSCPIIFLTAKELRWTKWRLSRSRWLATSPFWNQRIAMCQSSHLRREWKTWGAIFWNCFLPILSRATKLLSFPSKVLKFSGAGSLLLHLLATIPRVIFSAERLHTCFYPESSETQLRSISEYVYQIRQNANKKGCKQSQQWEE